MKDEKNKILESSMRLTLTNPNLQDLVTTATELGLDSVLVDGFLKEMPIVSTVVGLCKGTINVRDRFFVTSVA